MPKLPEHIRTIGEKFGLNSEADLWNCQGTWVILHAALERIAVQQGIEWSKPPQILSSFSETDVAMIAFGKMGDREEWSTGEASSDNYPKRGKAKRYPWAIAEKRAKDRVIIKLIGLAGYVYSEEESEDFRKPNGGDLPRGEVSALDQGSKTNRELRDEFDRLLSPLSQCQTLQDLSDWKDLFRDRLEGLPEDYRESLRGDYARKRDAIKAATEVAA